MRDTISIDRVNKLHPKVRAEVTAIIEGIESTWPLGKAIRITQGLRTIEEQNALYAKGRTTPGPKVTNAKGGQSYHNYGLAVDLAIVTGKKIEWNPSPDIVTAFKTAGWGWGGDFKSIKDNPHFERTFGFKVSQLLAMYHPGEYVAI